MTYQRLQTKHLLLTFLAGLLLFVSSAQAKSSGTWTDKYKSIKGQWSIIEDASGAKLVLGDDFSTRNAPDLKFILSHKTVAEMNGGNAIDGAVIIAPLKSNKGAQTYQLPKNFKDFKTLALHCEQYSKLWAATDISNQ